MKNVAFCNMTRRCQSFDGTASVRLHSVGRVAKTYGTDFLGRYLDAA